ncbi:MAG: GNAT family acetyltransferase [Immundisolibacterales bacterium]|nr:GNAT family acetyltransferase [Immundisolibacterales bacterium]
MTGGVGFRIRAIRDGDEDEVIELWRACDLVRPWNDPRRDIEGARARATSEVFVAVDEKRAGHIAGSVMAGFDGHRAWVYYVAVAPAHRSGGLGGRLMRHAESWLAGLGAPKVMLMIREENEGVRRFYDGLGYEVEKRTIMSRRVSGSPVVDPS